VRELDFVTIGKKIKKRRKAVGMTQDAVADILEVNASHISNIEGGRANPSLTALVNIANILECSVDCFLDGEYTYERDKNLDNEIADRLRLYDDEKKTRLLKMMDLL